jgi:hypothetical protein
MCVIASSRCSFDELVSKRIFIMIMCLGKKWIGGSNIRNTTINVADEKDMDFVESLQSLGVNRNVAR